MSFANSQIQTMYTATNNLAFVAALDDMIKMSSDIVKDVPARAV